MREITTVKLLEPEAGIDEKTIYKYDYPYYYSEKPDTRLNIKDAILEFYLLEELLLNFPDNFFLMERKKMSEMFISLFLFRKDLSEKLARALFDYLCVASLGEARHSSGKSNGISIKSYSLPKNSTERYTVYKGAHKYSPTKFLPKIYKVFSLGNWTSGFGGEKWANIVKAAMLYEKVPDAIFIDHIIDLAHNGGTAFDKDCILSLGERDNLRQLLDSKFLENGLINLIRGGSLKSSICITPQLKEIAIEIGARIIKNDVYFLQGIINLRAKELEFPVPIVWETEDIELDIDFFRIERLRQDRERMKREQEKENREFFNVFDISYLLKDITNLMPLYQSLKNTLSTPYCKYAEESKLEYKLMKKEERKLKKLNKIENTLKLILSDDDPVVEEKLKFPKNPYSSITNEFLSQNDNNGNWKDPVDKQLSILKPITKEENNVRLP